MYFAEHFVFRNFRLFLHRCEPHVRPWLFDMLLATVCISTYGPVYSICTHQPKPIWAWNAVNCEPVVACYGVGTFMLFGNLLCGATDSPFAPGLAVQLCLLHPRQYISLCISQNTSCFGISGCSCTAVNRMYGHGSLTCYWPRCAYQRMGQFTASAPTNQSPFGRGML